MADCVSLKSSSVISFAHFVDLKKDCTCIEEKWECSLLHTQCIHIELFNLRRAKQKFQQPKIWRKRKKPFKCTTFCCRFYLVEFATKENHKIDYVNIGLYIQSSKRIKGKMASRKASLKTIWPNSAQKPDIIVRKANIDPINISSSVLRSVNCLRLEIELPASRVARSFMEFEAHIQCQSGNSRTFR